MLIQSRRRFLLRSALCGAGGLAAARLKADPLGLPVGFQVFPIRKQLAEDFPGTLREMAGMGYRTVEMCSPPGYEKSGFGPLIPLKAAEMRRIISDAGLGCESCHYGFRELRENLDARIAYAGELGLRQMIVASLGLPKEAVMDDWRRAADEMNRFGAQTQAAGLQLGFHNHHGEFQKIGDVLIYDELLRRFDPKLVKMQFQVAVINIGYDAADYMTRHPGRFISLHLADWSESRKESVPVGQGKIDWKKLFTAARTGGVRNYYVEMDMDAMKASCPFLRQLKV
jgi:sugar phosphate isomerase/epimerase